MYSTVGSEIPLPRVSTPVGVVVVGVDGSTWGHEALMWAARHAWTSGSRVRVLRGPAGPDLPADLGLSHATHGYPGVGFDVRRAGNPMADLLLATRSGDLLVLGHRGLRRGPLEIGGMVQPLVAAAECDVVIVRGRHAAVRGENRCVLALPGRGPRAGTVRSVATELARVQHSGLHVECLEPIPPRRGSVGILPGPDRQSDLIQPHEVVARCTGADVVVVARTDTNSTRLGLVTRAAIQHAPCPVYVVH
ncbi:universal stress protein [Pseudonocardiaceae bacterium YIM PH 21723]|nr:universal stress protein [Pseudonocardiaceae bacterium YIM PH 21723]